jgi:hypothetical protein
MSLPVVYAVKGGRLASDLWRYKSGMPGAAEAGARLAAMLAVYLREHGDQVWRAAGIAAGPTLAAAVLSGQGRTGLHPLLRIPLPAASPATVKTVTGSADTQVAWAR